MNEEENTDQPDNIQSEGLISPSRPGGEKVIQPLENSNSTQKLPPLEALSEQPPLVPSPVAQPRPNVIQTPQSQQPPVVVPASASIYTQPPTGPMQSGLSASQMGYNKPKSKRSDFSLKMFVVKVIIGLAVLLVVGAVLVFTNIIALSEFKTINYTNSNGTTYKMDFYSRHSTTQLETGNTRLVSKVSKGGKFPIGLFITSGDSSNLNKNGIKTCSGPLPKALDVRNNHINQTVAVCYAPVKDGPAGVYIAGFEYNNQAHIVTISQNTEGADVSSPSNAVETLKKFGIEPYKPDIERIISSIQVK